MSFALVAADIIVNAIRFLRPAFPPFGGVANLDCSPHLLPLSGILLLWVVCLQVALQARNNMSYPNHPFSLARSFYGHVLFLPPTLPHLSVLATSSEA